MGSGDLLKMLEPVVRPVNPAGGAPRAGQLPIEARDFESLLSEAEAAGSAAEGEAGDASAAAGPPPDALAPLSGLGAVENASLRSLIARSRSEQA